MTETKELSVEDLYEGIAIGDPIRFREVDSEGGTWNAGEVRGVCRDGSIDIRCAHTGGLRALGLKYKQVQRKLRGPKGGTTWVDVTAIDAKD